MQYLCALSNLLSVFFFFFFLTNRTIPRGSGDLHPSSLSSACIGIIIISNRCTAFIRKKVNTLSTAISYSLVAAGTYGTSPFFLLLPFHVFYHYNTIYVLQYNVKPKSINYQMYSNDTSRRINNIQSCPHIIRFFFAFFFFYLENLMRAARWKPIFIICLCLRK